MAGRRKTVKHVGASAEQPHSGNGEGSGARFNTLAPHTHEVKECGTVSRAPARGCPYHGLPITQKLRWVQSV